MKRRGTEIRHARRRRAKDREEGAQCSNCGHPRSKHSAAREDDFACEAKGCKCPGYQ